MFSARHRGLRIRHVSSFKRALLFALALCAMLEGVPWDVADDRSSMTCAAGCARWGVLRLRVEGGGGIYSDGCRGGCRGRFVR